MLLPICGLWHVRAAEPGPADVEFFETKVRPILAERCYKCHSARSEKLKGGLRLDSRAGVLKGGDDGPVVIPGRPGKSKLIEAIHYQNPDLQMPPKSKLAETEIAALTEWVRLGVPWPAEKSPETTAGAPAFDFEKRRREHWAWQPIQVTKPPSTPGSAWPRNDVDRFLLAQLTQNKLKPAAPASTRALLRRVYFDLIGLPPSPAEVEAFVGDKSPQAYERTVDRLLGSPRFGERWARHWLDLVRYAETLGHEFDYPLQNAWRYRDYVIRALNADIPYDEFVTEHIAGDLLPSPRLNPKEGFNESVIGTAFFWMGQREHSPVDVRQHQAELIDNQIDVMSKTFLGLTVACARCHDHKFDAIRTADFYALYGVLESSRFAHKTIDPAPVQAIEQLRALKKRIRPEAVAHWSKQAEEIARYLLAAKDPGPADAGLVAPGLDADRLARWSTVLAKERTEAPSPLFAWSTFQKTGLLAATNNVHPERRPAKVFADAAAGGLANWFADGEAFSIGAGGVGEVIIGEQSRPIRVVSEPVLNNRVLSRRLQGALRSPGFIIEQRYAHILAAGRDSRARICVDNLTTIREPIYGGLMRTLASDELKWITIDLDMWRGHRAFIEFSDVPVPDPADDSKWGGQGWVCISQVVFSDSADRPPRQAPDWQRMLQDGPVGSQEELAARYQDALQRALAKMSHSVVTSEPDPELAWLDWLLDHDLLDTRNERLNSLLTEYKNVEDALASPRRVPAMVDGDGMDEHIFIRGNHKSPGEIAPRQFLAALRNDSPAPFKTGSGRLELAQCLTSPDDPLLARVMVNRVWLHLFGRGIVPTPDDFGALGQPPSNPQLLDWLANWFRTDARWSIKKLIRLLVTSNAYQMSSAATDRAAEEKDPDNAWFHHMPLKRLEGEAIRDAMLAISGRLDETMYGPSVPTHLTEFMDGRGRPGSSGPLDGAGRRSIYLEVRRNFLSPMMRAFDTPVPFTTIGRRTVSNVPAQSLILMNDPFVAEQARLWARRLQSEQSTTQQRIASIYLAAFGRPPAAEEVAKALAFLQTQGVSYGLNQTELERNEQVWADLCHVAFNLKEFIFIE